MRRVHFQTPDKMTIDTGHKTFDKQTNLLSDGNLIANTQIGHGIRAYNDTLSHVERPPGFLQAWDLDAFPDLPKVIRGEIRAFLHKRRGRLYQFHHTTRGRRHVHGYVLADYEHRHIKTWITGPTYKSRQVVETAREYVTNL